jgi:hypothetical protein
MEIERGLEALLEEARYFTAQSYRRARHVKTVTATPLQGCGSTRTEFAHHC